ncbi:hypothetical protein CYMTET_52127 [Cymbomonas tetramitiformis]|uniref:Uncharacterized protein n=1 Tax=Cymbomonas tetramitiformis TaxID=36881 RepID=A0AAE0BKT5_9CHLO|nr:hypothetical protein CYMTET_52127 [Cymbomonas tetramitiformis]
MCAFLDDAFFMGPPTVAALAYGTDMEKAVAIGSDISELLLEKWFRYHWHSRPAGAEDGNEKNSGSFFISPLLKHGGGQRCGVGRVGHFRRAAGSGIFAGPAAGSFDYDEEWESAQYEILGEIMTLEGPLQGVPEAAVERTHDLVEASLLQQGASSESALAFAGATAWDLPGESWAAIRPEAKRRIKLVKRWGEIMLGAIPAVLPAGSSQGSSGGSVTLSSAQLAELMKQAVTAALFAQSGWLGPSGDGGAASPAEWKRPARALEAGEFPEMRWAVPALEDEDCDIDELPGAHAATLHHWEAGKGSIAPVPGEASGAGLVGGLPRGRFGLAREGLGAWGGLEAVMVGAKGEVEMHDSGGMGAGFYTVLRKVKTDKQHRLMVYFKTGPTTRQRRTACCL